MLKLFILFISIIHIIILPLKNTQIHIVYYILYSYTLYTYIVNQVIAFF